jgi:hypothetical protein
MQILKGKDPKTDPWFMSNSTIKGSESILEKVQRTVC